MEERAVHTVARLVARLAAAVIVLAVMAGPVIAVAYAAGNPFPSDLLDRLAARNIDDATIVKILSLCFYACWAWFCGPALRQVWAAARTPGRVRSRHADTGAPVTFPATSTVDATVGARRWLAGLARFAVTGAVAASTVVPLSASPSVAAPASTETAAAAAAPAPAGVVVAAERQPIEVQVTSVQTTHRDSPYAIARRYFPPERIDAARDEILGLNVGRPMPDGRPYQGGGFPAGWTVVIPAIPATSTAATGAHRTSPNADPANAPSPSRLAGPPHVASEQPGPVGNHVDPTTSGNAFEVPATPADLNVERVATTTPADGSTGAETTVIVADGDTLWDLAVTRHVQAGAPTTPDVIAAYVAEVAAVNADQVDDPNLIYTGQQLIMPAIKGAPSAAHAPATDAPGPVQLVPDAGGAYEPVIHVIQLGDTLWDMLEAQHGHVDADMIGVVAERNGIEDPSNIPVGTPVTIGWRPIEPVPATDPATPVVPAPLPPAEAEPAAPPPASAATIPVASPPAPIPVAEMPDAARPVAPATTAPSATTTAPLPAGSTEPVQYPVGDDDGLVDWSTRTVWVSLPIGLLLAAGLTGMTRRLRSRRLSRLEPGEQTAAPPAVAAGTELAVSSGEPERRLTTLHGLLRTVTPYAREQADPPAVRSVELAEDRIEVLFTMPAPFPPHGWTTINGGTSWVHRLTDVAASPVRQLLTPALVTLGLRPGGGEVLLDLETAGSLALTGDRNVAQGMARAMTLELATYPLGVAMDVCLIGFDVDGAELCDRTWKGTTMTRAVRVAREVLERTATTGAASLIAARAATDEDEALLDPQVFVVDSAALDEGDVALLDELIGLCIPQSGAAVVIIGDHPDARERVTAESDELADWSGATLRPTPLDREAVAQVAVMFDHAANAAAEPLAPSPMIANMLDSGPPSDAPASNGDGPVGDVDVELVEPYRYVTPEFDVLVRVLGDVVVQGRPITSGVDVEMLSLLAFKRDQPPNVDTLRFLLEKRKRKTSDDGDPVVHDAVWESAASESAVKTLRNRASVLRRNLGVGADGTDLLPTAARAGTKGRYRLSSRVLTDVDLIEHRYHTALELASGDALPLLRDGLGLFAGPAFRGGGEGYAWIAPEGVLTRITTVVNAYATLLMQLAFDVDDLSLVLQTAAAAGRVIDDPVALLPMCEVQRQFAEASGDPDLAAAVLQAHRRLLAHAEQYDPLAGT